MSWNLEFLTANLPLNKQQLSEQKWRKQLSAIVGMAFTQNTEAQKLISM